MLNESERYCDETNGLVRKHFFQISTKYQVSLLCKYDIFTCDRKAEKAWYFINNIRVVGSDLNCMHGEGRNVKKGMHLVPTFNFPRPYYSVTNGYSSVLYVKKKTMLCLISCNVEHIKVISLKQNCE